VGAVGIELKAMLKARKLLNPSREKNVKTTESAQVRYTPGTWGSIKFEARPKRLGLVRQFAGGCVVRSIRTINTRISPRF
jgi:hypothetical protein